MIKVDFHTHSSFSHCGVHSVLEMLTYAKANGMKGLAITDHGPAIDSRINSVFFERLQNPIKGIELFKGLESNLTDKEGEIDFPKYFLPFTDIVLLGIHHNIEKGKSRSFYTDRLIKAIQNNPFVDVISHPNDRTYLLDFHAVAEAAKDLGIAFELNNSKLMLKRVDVELTREMINACMDVGCKMSLASDAHVVNELGCNRAIRPLIKDMGLSDDLFINSDINKAFDFINQRKKIKQKYY